MIFIGITFIICLILFIYILLSDNFSLINIKLKNIEEKINSTLINRKKLILDSEEIIKETLKTKKQIYEDIDKLNDPKISMMELDRKLLVYINEFYLINDKYKKLKNNEEFQKIAYKIIETEDLLNAYKDYYNDMSGFLKSLRYEINAMPKRKQYDFGNVLFHSDAKLKEYHTKRHETTSLEEECRIYRLENAELKSQIKDISQYHTDMQQTAESLRIALKKIDSLQKELETCETLYKEALSNNEQKESAYQKSAELISFYKNQIEIAALFPTDKDKICDWIENIFAENIVLTQRAKAEMRKYSGNLDISSFCDGVVYMNSYARYRKHEISEVELQLYAERNNWEVQNCGKETIKMRKSDYTVTYENEQYILDLHIKHGVKAEELLRIYFCWDEKRQKILIGSMPGHLATTRQGT